MNRRKNESRKHYHFGRGFSAGNWKTRSTQETVHAGGFRHKIGNLHVKTSLLHGGNGEAYVAKFRREIYDDM